jgi:hypothetical protein
MSIADCSRRQPPIQQPTTQILNIECLDGNEWFHSQLRSNVTTEKAVVILKALGSQPGFGADFTPAVEMLIKRLLGRIEISSQVGLTEHPIEVCLRSAQSAVDGFVQVLSFLGLGVASTVLDGDTISSTNCLRQPYSLGRRLVSTSR